MKRKPPVPAGRHDKKRGAARMKEMGYVESKINLDRKEFLAINRAARKDGKRLATWIREIAVLVATGPEYAGP